VEELAKEASEQTPEVVQARVEFNPTIWVDPSQQLPPFKQLFSKLSYADWFVPSVLTHDPAKSTHDDSSVQVTSEQE
jgi:hypothetical protein